jgi:hypothetical protein
MIGGAVLMAGATFAGQINEVRVNLPHPVTVGAVTLPVGEYEISNFEMGGEEMFIVRGDHSPVITLASARTDAGTTDKTELTLTKDGDQWHFDKLTVAGEPQAFQFLNVK